jgi:hypothetical protein
MIRRVEVAVPLGPIETLEGCNDSIGHVLPEQNCEVTRLTVPLNPLTLETVMVDVALDP